MVKFKVENLKYAMEADYSNSNSMNIDDIQLNEDDLNLDYNLNNNFLPKTITLNDLGKMLLVCASRGESDKVYELISRGAPFTADWLGNSALHLAAQSNHLQTCEILLRAGISKDARTKVDKTPLHFSAACNHRKIVELLLANKCDIDAKDMLKMTPLHWAVDNGHLEIVEILLNHNADVTIVSKFNKTAQIIAEMGNKVQILELIINHQMKISDKEQQEATEGLLNELNQQNALSKSYNSPTRIDVDQNPPSINQKGTYTPAISTSTPLPNCSTSSTVSTITPTFRTQAESEAITKRSDSSFFKSKTTPTVAPLQQNTKNISQHNTNKPDLESQQGKNRSIPMSTPKLSTTSSTNNFNSSRSASVLKILREHHGISMLPIDESDNLINSAIKSGRKVVISDGGKLILNDPTFNKLINSTPISKPVTVKSEVITPTFTTAASSSSSTAPITTTTTTTITNSSTMSALPKTAATTATTTTTSNKILHNIINNNNQVIKRKPTIILSSPQKPSSFPFHPNKVVKILSSDEFKQLCAEKNGSIKRLVNNSKVNGTFKVQTVTNPNELTQPKKLIDGRMLSTLMSKGKIINNGSLIRVQDQKVLPGNQNNQKPGDVKYIINRNGQNPSLFKIVSSTSTSSSTITSPGITISSSPSPLSSKTSTTSSNQPISPSSPSASSSSLNSSLSPPPSSSSSSSSAIIPTVTSTSYKSHSLILPIRNNKQTNTMTTNRTVTAVISPDSMKATNYISTSTVATKLLNNSNAINNATMQRHQKSFTSMMSNQQMEKQIIELKKQQDELRKQLELSQKLNEDFRLRLEKLEAANEQQTRKFESMNEDR